MPGSPPMRMALPGTRPPPSTRSSSSLPVEDGAWNVPVPCSVEWVRFFGWSDTGPPFRRSCWQRRSGKPFCALQRYSTRRSPGSSPASARSHTRRKRRHSRFFPWPRGYSCSAARGGMRLSRRACPYHTSRMGQAAMTGLREWCRAGEKSFALIRQMNAKEYTDSVYHKTGREAARKK